MDSRTLFLIGAGATRGASFTEARGGTSTPGYCLPPLDRDFFSQLQRLRAKKHQKKVQAILRGLSSWFGHNFRVGLEEVFAAVAQLEELATKIEQKIKSPIQSETLRQAIAAVMEEGLCEWDARRSSPSSRQLDCEYHQWLVKDIIRPKDSIITFNYDCLLDCSLKLHGSGKWNPNYGYCLPKGKGKKLVGREEWEPAGVPCGREVTVKLLKLHGSLHFKRGKGQSTLLKKQPYTFKGSDKAMSFRIIPPQYSKNVSEEPYRTLWRQAVLEIKQADRIVVIGYSFPGGDLPAYSLFRLSLKKDQLDSVVLVDPSSESRQRARKALQPGFREDTRIVVFNSLAEFSKTTRDDWENWPPGE